MANDSNTIGNHIITFAKDDYNKAIGESLIDAKNDAEAISSFLLQFRDSPSPYNLTLKKLNAYYYGVFI